MFVFKCALINASLSSANDLISMFCLTDYAEQKAVQVSFV